MRNNINKLFILFGAPGGGKSTSLGILSSCKTARIKVITKETTRPRRAKDGKETKSVKKISDQCSIKYSQYGVDYGFSTKKIWECLSTQQSAAIIVNDIRTIRILKQKFGILAKCIYIHSNIDRERMIALALQRREKNFDSTSDSDTLKRIEKIKTIHRKYIENTSLFDYTILNINKISDLRKQINNIINDDTTLMRPSKSSVKIFIIVGASYSGKDGMVNAMQEMEVGKVVNYMKVTTRPKRSTDKNELRHVREIPKTFNIKYRMQGFTYAISTKELWQSLSKGKVSLLVLSDKAAIEKLVNQFGEICTVLYLHANFDVNIIEKSMKESDVKGKEIKQRLRAIDELFQLYLERTTMFDHVLLNTAEPEDLYDQVFNIMDYYC